MNPFHWLFDKFYPAIRFLYERVQGNRWFDRIAPQLWLGGAPTYERDYQFLLDNGITAVLDMRAEREGDRAFYDATASPTSAWRCWTPRCRPMIYLSEGADWIDEQIDDGRTVLVHCAKGRGRSATLVAAYMMRHEDLPYDECRTMMKDARPLVKAGRSPPPPPGAWHEQSKSTESRLLMTPSNPKRSLSLAVAQRSLGDPNRSLSALPAAAGRAARGRAHPICNTRWPSITITARCRPASSTATRSPGYGVGGTIAAAGPRPVDGRGRYAAGGRATTGRVGPASTAKST
jgi:hypothetical protein